MKGPTGIIQNDLKEAQTEHTENKKREKIGQKSTKVQKCPTTMICRVKENPNRKLRPTVSNRRPRRDLLTLHRRLQPRVRR